MVKVLSCQFTEYRDKSKFMGYNRNNIETPPGRVAEHLAEIHIRYQHIIILRAYMHGIHAPRGNQLRLTGSACINKVILLILHFVNILHHLHVIIYTFYITSFAYSTLHYLHIIVFICFTLYIYKCATLMYFLSFFLADANF